VNGTDAPPSVDLATSTAEVAQVFEELTVVQLLTESEIW
jgi:hypothetical protein